MIEFGESASFCLTGWFVTKEGDKIVRSEVEKQLEELGFLSASEKKAEFLIVGDIERHGETRKLRIAEETGAILISSQEIAAELGIEKGERKYAGKKRVGSRSGSKYLNAIDGEALNNLKRNSEKIKLCAIDLETATVNNDKICSIALVSSDGERIDHLIQPPDNYFDKKNIGIHGITQDMTINSPTFKEVWYKNFIDLDPSIIILAHYASFDLAVLSKEFIQNGIQPIKNPILCTWKLARSLLDIPKKGLKAVAREYQVDDFQHHNALEDAQACFSICQKMMERENANNVFELAEKAQVSFSVMKNREELLKN